jgi:hypothetical protein
MIGNAIAGLYGGGVPPVTSAYESIATSTVGSGGTGTITFSSIPATFKSLQIRMMSQTNRTPAVIDSVLFRFNGDTASNYWYHTLQADGATVAANNSGTAVTRILPVINGTASSAAGANVFGVGIIDIIDYASTTKYKTLRGFLGSDSNGAGTMGIGSGMWNNTAAITSITISMVQGTLFSEYSQFALYGIKGA